MKAVLVLCFVLYVAAAYDVSSDYATAARTLNRLSSNVQSFIREVSVTSHKRAASSECVAAYLAYTQSENADCSFDQTINSTSLVGICSTKCKTIFGNLVSQCVDESDNQTRLLTFFLSILCLKDSTTGAFCYPKFQLLSENSTVTAATLNQFCGGDCITQMLSKMLSEPSYFNSEDVRSLQRLVDLACLKSGGTFCLLTFQDWSNLNECGEGDFTCLNSRLSVLCTSKCLFKVLARLQSWNITVDFDPAAFNFLCMKKPNSDQYCVPVVQSAIATVGSNCPDLEKNTCSSATPNCPSALQTAKATMGCCLRTYFNYDAIENPVKVAAIISNLETCGLPITAQDQVCVLPGLLRFSKSFKINTPWAIAKPIQAFIKTAVEKDLTSLLGIKPSKVEIRESVSDGLTEVYFECQGPSDQDTEDINAQFDAQTTSTVFLPATSAAVVQSNPGQAVSVVPGSVQTTFISSSASSLAITFSFLLLGLLFVF